MSTETLTDAVLGTLQYKRDSYEWSEWIGRSEFKPGLPVEVVFNEWRYGKETREEQLAKVRKVYLDLIECESSIRVDAVCSLVIDGDWPGVPELEDIPDPQFDAMIDQWRLIRVSLHSDGSAGLEYLGPDSVTGGRELHVSADGGEFAGYDFHEIQTAPNAKPSVIEVLRETELFRAVAEQYPGVEIWPDPNAPDDGCDYAWIMSVEGKSATNLGYFRLQGDDSLQLKIKNRDDETRWLDLSGFPVKKLLEYVRPRWRFS